MRSDDVLEWLAAACFVAAGYFFVGLTLALLVGGVCLAYFAQCYSFGFRLPRLRRREKRPQAPPKADGRVLFHCNACGAAEPVDPERPHRCSN